jgi:hypothetical protein
MGKRKMKGSTYVKRDREGGGKTERGRKCLISES